MHILDPNNTAALLNRGILYCKQESLDLALSDFNEAIKINPNSDPLYVNRGVAYGKSGMAARARADFVHALALNPYNKEAKKNLTYVDTLE
ncbi:MAG: tetratricopeptide repeat protein [Candidatus Omnitrophota bacterium]